MKLTIYIFSFLVLSTTAINAQNIECIGNTIEIPLSGYKNGSIQWQFSANGNEWNDLAGSSGINLTHTISETGYFRAKVNYGNCEYYSDITFIQAFPASIANAGADLAVTSGASSISLDANIAEVGTGIWSIISGTGGEFSDSANPKATFSGQLGKKYVVSWNISSECINTSDKVSISFFDPLHLVSDYDGNIYNTVNINGLEWMAENLKTTHYNNGDEIETTVPADLSISSNATLNYQWAYLGDEANVNQYGRLYTWFAATDYRNACPAGWHLPSNDEWIFLEESLGGFAVAGGKMKETGTNHWINPNLAATNESGFTALPGGNRSYDGNFSLQGSIGGWWSSSDYDWEKGKDWYLYNTDGILKNGTYFKTYGVSVRCVKD